MYILPRVYQFYSLVIFFLVYLGSQLMNTAILWSTVRLSKGALLLIR